LFVTFTLDYLFYLPLTVVKNSEDNELGIIVYLFFFNVVRFTEQLYCHWFSRNCFATLDIEL